MTWYIVAPMDETHQSFRDEVYQSAAIGHLKVDNHCERYWRGTNSFHVKKMHTSENESQFNHNHYRVRDDRDITPIDVEQHLMGFVEAQRTLGLVDGPTEKFLTTEEASQIVTDFKIYHTVVNHEGPAIPSQTIDGIEFSLPERDISILTAYKNSPDQVFTEEDIKEWEENRHKEEPCVGIRPDMPLVELLIAVQDGMRGLGSELAQTRQVAGSKLKAHAAVVIKDDVFKPVEVKTA